MATPIDYGRFDEGRHLNYWELDYTLQRVVRRALPESDYADAEPLLSAFGETVGTEIADNADVVDANGPELRTYDERGEVANEVIYHPAHLENERRAYESGIVADCFHPPEGRDEPLPFTHNLAMQYLLCYADVGLDCPVAMTTGVALVIERFEERDGPLEPSFEGLTARDHDDLIEGAMFLTEKQGGSDVGTNETRAEYDGDEDVWRLSGEKWFCSNIDAEGTLALARREGAPDGTAGLSLFLVPHTASDGTLNAQTYRRLKDKLGTISVPTGEVELHGAEAYPVGDLDGGFTQMAEMLNVERLSNAAGACGLIGRALLESKIHAANREAFGRTLDGHPLMRADLVDMAVDHEAATAYTFEAARLFSRRETARRRGEEDRTAYRLMRALVPIAKARTGRMAVEAASYAMEIRGGDGYVTDSVTHRLLRDAQVLPIWEGTENVLSLDLLRALDRENAHEPLLSVIDRRLESVEHHLLAADAKAVRAAYDELGEALVTIATEGEEYAQLSAKRLLHFVFDVFTAALLLVEAQTGIDERDDAREALVARRFVDRRLRDHPARGITNGDRLPDEAFDAIVRFERVAPEEVESLGVGE